jgi:hypothetical protein
MMPAIVTVVVHVVVAVTPSATVVVIVVERKVTNTTTTSYHCMTPNSSSTGQGAARVGHGFGLNEHAHETLLLLLVRTLSHSTLLNIRDEN